MTTTMYHFEDGESAESVCLKLATAGWAARWSADRLWTHVYATHEESDTVRVDQAILAMDPFATACNCPPQRFRRQGAAH